MARRMSESEFIEKAISVHGDKYDYARVGYKANRAPVTITCRVHGDFSQEPSSHLQGRGCLLCSGLKRKTTEEFIAMAEAKRPGEYEFHKTNYINSKQKVTITCKRHGDFSIAPAHVSVGYGCPYCSSKKINTASFIEKATLAHGGYYDYSKTECDSASKKVLIICPVHGEFMTEASSHLAGTMCKKCQTYGFKRSDPASIYCLVSDCESMIKIGITSDVARRSYFLSTITPFGFRVEMQKPMDGEAAFMLERSIKNEFESAGLIGFNGCTEWLKYDASIFDRVNLS